MTPSRDSTDPTPDVAGVIKRIEREASGDSKETPEQMNGRLLRIVTLCRQARVSEPEGEREGFSVARCPEHGLHGLRTECYVCGGPVEQVPVVPLARAQELERERDEARAELERFYAYRRTPTQMTEVAVKVPYHVSGGLPFVDRQTFLGMIGQASEQVQWAEEAARDFAATLAHIAEDDGDCPWAEREAAEALARHPGFAKQ